MIDHTVAEGFVKMDQRENLIIEDNPAILLQRIREFSDVASDYWIDFKRI